MLEAHPRDLAQPEEQRQDAQRQQVQAVGVDEKTDAILGPVVDTPQHEGQGGEEDQARDLAAGDDVGIVEKGHRALAVIGDRAAPGDEARHALDLDPNDANALAVRALAVGNLGDFAACADYAERALAIDRSCVLAYRAKGWRRIFTGRPVEGRETILYGIRLDPRMESNPSVRSIIAMSYYFERDYETAVAEAARLIADRPGHPWAYRWLAAALGQLGRVDEARAALDKAIGAAPDSFRLFVEQRMPWMGQAIFDHMLEGLRKAGWQGRGETQAWGRSGLANQ